MHWTFYLLFTITGTTLFMFFIKLSGGKIGPLTGATIMQIAALVLVAAIYFIKFEPGQNAGLSWNSPGVIYSVLAGLAIGVTNASIFFMYHAGAPLALSNLVMRIGPIILSGILGFLYFKEHINKQELIGMALAMIGLMMIFQSRIAQVSS
tara:strand:- start:699 stop:1151 length:453 start_codon:yes stop_codon:yes gene_type:complete